MASTSGRDPASLAVRSWAGMVKRTIGTMPPEPAGPAEEWAGRVRSMVDDLNSIPGVTARGQVTVHERFPLPDQQAYDRYQELAADMDPKMAMARAAAEAEQRYETWQKFISYAAGARNPDGGLIYTVADVLAAGSELARCSGPGWATWSTARASDMFGLIRRSAMGVPDSAGDQRLPREVMADACDLYSRRQAAAFAARRAEADRAWQDYQRAMLAADTAYETAMAAAAADYDRVVGTDA